MSVFCRGTFLINSYHDSFNNKNKLHSKGNAQWFSRNRSVCAEHCSTCNMSSSSQQHKAPCSFSRTRLSADRMLAVDLRVLGFSIVSISTVVVLEGQGLSASIELAGLAAKVTAMFPTVVHPALLFLEAN